MHAHLKYGLALALTLVPAVQAQIPTYPSRPLRMIVPGMAGTSPDLLARIIAHHLTPRLGQPIVIVNQPGGGGNIGIGTAAKGTPDGYTLLVTSDQLSINESLFSNLPHHAVRSFAPVVQAIVSPQVLIVHPGLPFKEVAGLVVYAKTNAILKDLEASASLVKIGFTPVGGTAAQFGKLVASDIDRWGRVIREAKIKIE